MISHTERVLSRAARTQERMEFGFCVSEVRKRMTWS